METKAQYRVILRKRKKTSSCAVPREKKERMSADAEPLVGRETFSPGGFNFLSEVKGSIIHQ